MLRCVDRQIITDVSNFDPSQLWSLFAGPCGVIMEKTCCQNGCSISFYECWYCLYVSRRIFGPRSDEVTEEWRRLHNEELNDLYCSPNIVGGTKSRRMRWAGHVGHMGEDMGVYRVLVGKPEGKRPLGRPRRRWVDNIRMDLQEVGCGYMDWIGVARDRDRRRTLVSAVMNLRVL